MRFGGIVRDMSKGTLAPSALLAPLTFNPTSPIAVQSPGIAASSVVGPRCALRGDIEEADELRVSGQVNGNIRCSRLVVEKGGSIIGNISAEELIARGEIKGTIRAKRITL